MAWPGPWATANECTVGIEQMSVGVPRIQYTVQSSVFCIASSLNLSQVSLFRV